MGWKFNSTPFGPLNSFLALQEAEIPSPLWTKLNDCSDSFFVVVELVVCDCCSGGYGGGDGVHGGGIF